MTTQEGSEKGEMRDDYYLTEEIKVCPSCNKKVLERYEAKYIEDEKIIELNNEIQS